jgi:hypothetical protein
VPPINDQSSAATVRPESPVIRPQSRIQSCRISATAGSSGPGLVAPREDGRKTTYSGAVQDAEPRSRHYCRNPIGPRVLLVQPRTFQPSASSPPRRDYLPARPPVEARQQSSLGSHPTERENPSLLRTKSAAPQVHRCPCKTHLHRKSQCAVKAFAPEDGRPFEAWTGSAVPASVSLPTVSALPRVFAAIAASALDAAARLAVF